MNETRVEEKIRVRNDIQRKKIMKKNCLLEKSNNIFNLYFSPVDRKTKTHLIYLKSLDLPLKRLLLFTVTVDVYVMNY
jgi:hypothetical protein